MRFCFDALSFFLMQWSKIDDNCTSWEQFAIYLANACLKLNYMVPLFLQHYMVLPWFGVFLNNQSKTKERMIARSRFPLLDLELYSANIYGIVLHPITN